MAERGKLRRLINRIVGNITVAEDIAQDAFVKLSDRSVSGTDRALLVRTAQNLALDHLRARRVRDRYARAVLSDPHVAEVPGPENALAARQELNAFLLALKALPKRTQQIFLLNRLDGMSYPKIAEALGVSVSTVEKDMIRALLFCRAWQHDREEAISDRD
jgi:RNA polymerase sigma-70 factor (ECF subfamily)